MTRRNCVKDNPAALLAAMWYYATDGIGSKDMVILPYKDRLGLFSKYLQQLVMESLGKNSISTVMSLIRGLLFTVTKGQRISMPMFSSSVRE